MSKITQRASESPAGSHNLSTWRVRVLWKLLAFVNILFAATVIAQEYTLNCESNLVMKHIPMVTQLNSLKCVSYPKNKQLSEQSDPLGPYFQSEIGQHENSMGTKQYNQDDRLYPSRSSWLPGRNWKCRKKLIFTGKNSIKALKEAWSPRKACVIPARKTSITFALNLCEGRISRQNKVNSDPRLSADFRQLYSRQRQ